MAKGTKPARPNPAHEPGDDRQRDDEGNDETDREHDPVVRVHRTGARAASRVTRRRGMIALSKS